MKKTVVIATIKSWNIEAAEKLKDKYNISLITKKEDLTYEKIVQINPDFIFFPHWSWIIPETIHENFKCVGFHMTDLPFGRGGSPLQNLILRKEYKTKISALEVDEGIDTGRIFLKEDLDISEGSAEDIFRKMAEIISQKMIPKIIESNLSPHVQEGEVVQFKRRTPEQSDISLAEISSQDEFYDFVRMLDAQGYPKAFLEIGGQRIEFSGIEKNNKTLHGKFTITSE